MSAKLVNVGSVSRFARDAARLARAYSARCFSGDFRSGRLWPFNLIRREVSHAPYKKRPLSVSCAWRQALDQKRLGAILDALPTRHDAKRAGAI
jgi:hypothetical protein